MKSEYHKAIAKHGERRWVESIPQCVLTYLIEAESTGLIKIGRCPEDLLSSIRQALKFGTYIHESLTLSEPKRLKFLTKRSELSTMVAVLEATK